MIIRIITIKTPRGSDKIRIFSEFFHLKIGWYGQTETRRLFTWPCRDNSLYLLALNPHSLRPCEFQAVLTNHNRYILTPRPEYANSVIFRPVSEESLFWLACQCTPDQFIRFWRTMLQSIRCFWLLTRSGHRIHNNQKFVLYWCKFLVNLIDLRMDGKYLVMLLSEFENDDPMKDFASTSTN